MHLYVIALSCEHIFKPQFTAVFTPQVPVKINFRLMSLFFKPVPSLTSVADSFFLREYIYTYRQYKSTAHNPSTDICQWVFSAKKAVCPKLCIGRSIASSSAFFLILRAFYAFKYLVKHTPLGAASPESLPLAESDILWSQTWTKKSLHVLGTTYSLPL